MGAHIVLTGKCDGCSAFALREELNTDLKGPPIIIKCSYESLCDYLYQRFDKQKRREEDKSNG